MRRKTVYTRRRHFEHWHERATVRTQPPRVIDPAEAEGMYFHPESVPASLHPLVAERGETVQRKVLIHHLYTYLDFTENLEHEVVNHVAYTIARRRIPGLPRSLELDALKLYIDEANHTWCSADLKQQVIDLTKVAPVALPMPNFLRSLGKIEAQVGAEHVLWVRVFFTIVSETLISSTLTKVPRDERVVGGVRQVLKDHADDEAIHHAYFAGLLRRLWPRLSKRQRKIIGPLLPEFIFGFLEPDYRAIIRNLGAVGLAKAEATAVIEDSYPRREVLAGIREASAVTVAHFYESGVFEDDDIAEAFADRGLDPRRCAGDLSRISIDDDLFQGTENSPLVKQEARTPASQ